MPRFQPRRHLTHLDAPHAVRSHLPRWCGRFPWLVVVLIGCVIGGRQMAARHAATSAQASERPQPPRVGAGTGVISGVVVDATTSRPVAGALVALTPIAGNVAGTGLRQVADGEGRFAFTRLSAGDGYQINASEFGYLDGGFGRLTPDSTTRPIVLQDGQWFRDVTITLWRPAAINGAVRDEAGEPVVGAFVRLLAQVLIAGQPWLAAGPVTKTDDRGTYRIANLRPGVYFVVVPSVQVAVPAETSLLTLSGMTAETFAQRQAAGGPVTLRRDPALPIDPANRLLLGTSMPPPPASANGKPQAYPMTFYPSARTVASAMPFELRYGDDRQGIDLQLQPVPVVRVSGRIDGPTEELTNITARLMPAGSEMLGTGSEAATALVAPNGTFTLLNVPAGSYTILVCRSVSEYTSGQRQGESPFPIPPGEARGGGSGTVVFSGPAGTTLTNRVGGSGGAFSGRTRIDVGDSNVNDVVVTLQRGVTLSGRIVVERAASPATPSRAGAGGLMILTEPANGDPTFGQPRGATDPSDPTMSFAIDGLRAGEYFVRMNTSTIKSIAWNGNDYANMPFDASSGQDISGVVVTTTDQMATMTGTVHDATGAIPTNAVVIYFPQERAQRTKFGLQPPRLRSLPTTSAGTFSISRAPAGDYFLIAVDETSADGWKDPRFLEAAANVATRVSVGWGETKTQSLVVQQIVTK